MNKPVLCDYCGNPAKLVDSAIVYHGHSYGMIWHCRACDAYVGVHKNNDKCIPLGRLANAELRAWKVKAHAAFDPLWKNGKMPRGKAYAMLQKIMNLPNEHAHIGLFNVDQCKQLGEKLQVKESA